VEREPLVGLLATLLAEYKSRKAVGAPPLKWSRHAALARCRSLNALRIEEAKQVGANPRDKFLNVGALGLRNMSNIIEEGHVGYSLSSFQVCPAPPSQMFRRCS
jgi:hypothetical protein